MRSCGRHTGMRLRALALVQENQSFGKQILVEPWAKVTSLCVVVSNTATQHSPLIVVCRFIVFYEPSKLDSDQRQQYAESVLRLALCYFDDRPSVSHVVE